MENVRYACPVNTRNPMPKSHDLRRAFDTVKAREKMDAAGKSYADIGRALGYERQAVGHWFRGRGEPNVQQMKKMAEVLGCHWLELVTDDTMIVYRDDERARLEKMRRLSDDALAELDAFIAFKSSSKGSETG